jgi:hypothetical protein
MSEPTNMSESLQPIPEPAPAPVAPEAPTEEPPSVAPETPTEAPEEPPSAASSPVDQWTQEDADSGPECDGCHRPEDDCICGLDECWHCGDYYDPEKSGWSNYCSGGCASDDGYFRGYARHAASSCYCRH